ncbi:MAG TPA: sulfatase-like hydrolase/transferase [Thermoanaerobaculia bacterium]|nr:sulfatase-like hydrolase/transferase [Thermoanaerobaculia bacterium]
MMFFVACHRERSAPPPPAVRPSVLLVTLDTTRADAIGPDQRNAETPAFNALAARGRSFTQAYATVPQTLPSHASMMTGLYPAGHGVHENGRYLSDRNALLAQKLHGAGYRTAAFVSAFSLARRFGLAPGFDVYDDEFGGDATERDSKATTDRVDEFLAKDARGPLFLWVHFYDPHYPYAPPEPFRSRYAKQPYFGEVAAMDAQFGRLVQLFEQRVAGSKAIVVVADHGEGLGDHGESQHGNLLYQPTMHVPLLFVGPGIAHGFDAKPISTRRIFQTILDWASVDSPKSEDPVVVGEAMKPFFDYGWQPQVMAVDGRFKSILAGRLEVYDVIADPSESHDLAASASVSRSARAALQEYPIPSAASATPPPANDEERKKLASLGYVASTTKPVVRKDAPRPAAMTRLFPILDQASGLFVREQYREAIPLFEQIVSADPANLDAVLHLAAAYSTLGRNADALDAFRKAQSIAPESADVRTYLGLHYVRTRDWEQAAPLLERVVADDPDRLPAIEGLATVREQQARIPEAVALRKKAFTMRTPTGAELVRLGELAMSVGDTATALDAFEKARATQGAKFANDLELGVLYLSANHFAEARDALDRVPPTHPGYPMALFKRAQVSVLLHEEDAPARIAAARQHANAMTRELIAKERLFQ